MVRILEIKYPVFGLGCESAFAEFKLASACYRFEQLPRVVRELVGTDALHQL